jgi:hypothetical protein
MDNQEETFGQKEVEGAIEVLRQAGFFRQYTRLSRSEIYDLLHQERIKQYSVIFEREYDPGMNLNPYQIACLDHTKMVYFDTEADVMNGNNVYVDLIRAIAEASDGEIQPVNISEVWETDNGPITVQFQSKGESIVFHPEYMDDWVADELFHTISDLVQGDFRFYVCQDEHTQLGCGQDVGVVRLTKGEVEFLEKACSWKFYKL